MSNVLKNFTLCTVIAIIGCGRSAAPVVDKTPPEEKAKIHSAHAEQAKAQTASQPAGHAQAHSGK